MKSLSTASGDKRCSPVMPGHTGLWQVSGGRSNTSYDERVNLDMQYIDNWSIFMDIAFLLKTIPAVMKG